ncbi:MAG: hypothetical protein LBM74_09040 [Oscillospiraceae bacterium]|jgi:hypothetical protein|nr:hypothetical protein [Oscillospiraceae bacterium]
MIDVEMLRPTADEMLSGLTAGEPMRRRIALRARGAESLPAVAGEMLSGLKVTPALRHRILVAADRERRALLPAPPRRAVQAFAARFPLKRLTPALGMAMALALMIGLGLQYGSAPEPANMGGLSSYAAGSDALPADGSQVRSLYAGTSAEPPLIVINGRYYRMLNTPAAVPAELLGGVIAEIQGHSDELELAANAGVLSNIAQPGAKVYEVGSLPFKTAIAAEVDGAMRLFQRAGYASTSVIGNEMFEDTLAVAGNVAALELSGVGFIDDEELANTLVSQLIEFSAFHSSEIPEGEGALTIYLKNDLTLQLMVQGDVYGGCGAWANVEFREAFEAALAAK